MQWLSSSWRQRPGLLHERIAAEVQDAISRGQISLGTELPTVRALTTLASVSKVTASQALDQLIETGWAERRDRAPALARTPEAAKQRIAPVDLVDAYRGTHDFQAARVAAPVDAYLAALARAQKRLPSELLGSGRIARGHRELRRLIAKRFSESGLRTTAEQVIVTNGAMGAFAAMVDNESGPVLVEDPTYHVALAMLAAKRRRVVGWARSPSWDADSLERLLQRTKPTVAFLVPDFHNPSGALATATERRQVGKVLRTISSLKTVVIDETFFDLDLRDSAARRSAPVSHFAALTSDANIITIGGLSKIAWAGLRIGWARIPDPEQRAKIAANTDVTPPPILDQLIAIELWPELDRIIRSRIRRLRVQRNTLCELLEIHELHTMVPLGGLSAWVDLGAPLATSLADRLHRRGWFVSQGSAYSATQTFDRFMRLPFTHEPAVIEELFSILGPELAQLRLRASRA